MRGSLKTGRSLFAACLIFASPPEASPADAGQSKNLGRERESPQYLSRAKSGPPAPNPEASSGFLPTRMTPRDGAQLALFRKLATRFRTDSTRHWEIRDGELRLSHDLIQDLTGEGLQASGLGKRLASILVENHGLQFIPSGRAFGAYLPNDKWLQEAPQWGLHNPGTTLGERPGKEGVDIGMSKVWDKFGGSDTLVIAVLDAGFDFLHPDLKGRHWVNKAEAEGLPGVDDDNNGYVDDSIGWDFVERDNHPQDAHGHGTYISSVIAARFDNGEGIAGVLAEGKIMPLRVLDASGHGNQTHITKAIHYAVENGAHAINFSIGGNTDSPALRTAFQAARDRGVPVIVAAGNNGWDLDATPTYPAAYNYANLLVVAAHDHAGRLSSFSNYGATSAHLAAPGEFVLVCGLPAPMVAWSEDFEAAALDGWTVSAGGFALSSQDPLEGLQSLAWSGGRNNDTAMAPDYLDLRGKKGGALRFRMDYKPAHGFDAVIIEGNKKDSSLWREIAVIGSEVKAEWSMAFGLQDFDGFEFRVRIRTTLPSRFSASARALKIDGISMTLPDPDRPADPVYTVVDGTSVAAPHVAAYVGLQRLACDRTATPWTRSLALNGIAAEPALAGKVSTDGRLDAYKGLEFYLSSLPDFRVLDSAVTTWKSGEKVQYTLGLNPTPGEAYLFSENGLPDGATLDGAGRLVWSPGPAQAGKHTLRLLAVGPTTMRKRFDFTVEAEGQVVAVRPSGASRDPDPGILRIAGKSFRIRPGMASGRHLVEIVGMDAAGKIRILQRRWMDASEFRGQEDWPVRDRLFPAAAFTHLQVRVDGAALAPLP